MSIDAHIHLFHRGLPRAPRRRHDPAYDATLDALEAIAAPCGVERFVVVQPSFLGYDNSYLIGQIRAHPRTLRGVAVLDPTTRGSEIDALLRIGVVGLRLNLLGTDLAHSLSRAQLDLVEQCAQRGMSVELHDTCARLPLAIDAVAPRAQRVVIDHFGRPDAAVGGVASAEFSRLLQQATRYGLFFKISAPYRSPGLQVRKAFDAIAAAVGENRLLWGSDWPWTQHEDRIDYAGWCRPFDPDEDLPRRLAPAAQAFYGFDTEAASGADGAAAS